jgi:hypothetical protein
MATPKKFLVPNTPVQGRIPGTVDYGFTEAIGNILQPGIKNPGLQQAYRNFLNPKSYLFSEKFNLPKRPEGMSTAQPTVTTTTTDTTPAGEREYEAEKSRVAQLTEQDPLFKKYQIAELSKQYNAAKGDEREKIGMQIWAQTNPDLARKLKPGATGYSDVSTAFQNLSPLKGVMPQYSAQTSFTAPAVDASTMPGGIGQAFTTPLNIPGLDTSALQSSVASGAFTQPLPKNVTDYLTDPVQAYAPSAGTIDEKQRQLIAQAYNQRIK